MYCTDAVTGETRFELPRPVTVHAREVFLECFNLRETFRVPMIQDHARWTACMDLPTGWFFHRYHVDGRPRWDRDAGTMRTSNGARCSLAIINHRHPARA